MHIPSETSQNILFLLIYMMKTYLFIIFQKHLIFRNKKTTYLFLIFKMILKNQQNPQKNNFYFSICDYFTYYK